jgi:putative tryptophan/tyrosine transport system substrate-binding protein
MQERREEAIMWRRTVGVIVTLTLGILAAPVISTAQPPATIPRIGVLSPAPPGPRLDLDAFRQGLRELGYVEGQTILLEYRYADWQLDRLPALAAELVQRNPDVIYTFTTAGGLAAKQVTTTVPIVVSAGGLVEQGIVASLARPGGTMTGVTLTAELYAKQLELLKEAAPHIARVAILLNPANPGSELYPASLAAEARALGVQLHRMEVRVPGEFEGAFAAIAEGRVDALVAMSDPMFGAHRQRIVELAATHRLPSISRSPGFAEAGGLMQYGEDIPEMHRRAATHVHKILQGAKPAELPVERALKFKLVLNLKTAKALGITMPPSLLLLADEVIQ